MMMRLYRLLLRLYPAGFRREYGEGMCDVFEEQSRGVSGIRRVVLLVDAAADVVANALPLHVEMLRQDLHYTARSLRRAPGFAVTAVLVTAVAVGANTAAFSVADFVLLRALPFPQPESLVRLCAGPGALPAGWGCNNQLSPADYRDLRDQTRSFAALGAFLRGAVNLTGGGEPERVSSATVTADVLPLLGVQPLLGAWPDGSDPDTRTVVLSHELWQSRFGGDPGVTGRVVNLDGVPHVVAAVMPAGFHFPSRDTRVWPSLHLEPDDFLDRSNNYLEAVGRLAGGVSFDEARADLDVVIDRLARTYPETNEETGVSFFRMRDEYSPRYALMLRALCGAALCILLLACANLANLLLARASARERELAVRTALGAGRERIARQLFTESVTLALFGGAAGVVLAVLIMPLLSLLVPASLPIAGAPELNLRLLALAALFTALTGVGFGMVPAMRAAGGAALAALRGRTAPHRRRYRAVLVAIEVGVCVVLLVASGLLIRAVLRVQAVEAGFRAEGVLTVRTVLPKPEYAVTEKRELFYRAVLTEVRRLPGVQAAAYTSGLPTVFTGGITRVTLPGQEIVRGGDYLVSRRYITPQYFDALGIPLLAGRDLEDADAGRGRVAVVSASFAQRYWPGEDAVGRSFVFQDSLRTVVGVVGDVRVRGLERTSEPQMYLPSSHIGDTPLSFHDPKDLVIRTTGRELALVPAVRDIVRRVDPNQPISDVATLGDVLARQTSTRRSQLHVLAALAAVALVLAGLGIHGLLAQTVAQRRHDIAVRLALGAEPARIARRVVGDGMGVVLLGLLPGLLVAWAAARSMQALLFGVPTLDPVTLLSTLAVCVAMALAGAWLPARRAVRVSPMLAMRAE